MQAKQIRGLVEWCKNLIIIGLLCSAVYLVGQTTLYEGFGTLAGNEVPENSISAGIGDGRISVQPVRIAVQNTAGRYGLQYDQETVDQLFEEKLGSLLREALGSVKELEQIEESQWRAVVKSQDSWIYYDFLTNLPLNTLPFWLGSQQGNEALYGQSRTFLLAQTGDGYSLYFYDDDSRIYTACTLTEESVQRFNGAIADIRPNNARFPFEFEDDFTVLDQQTLIFPKAPSLPVYVAENPLTESNEETLEAVLRTLSFDPNGDSYKTAEQVALQEGAGTLRILRDGTLVYHSQEGDGRYPLSGESEAAMIEDLYTLLLSVMGNHCGAIRPYFLDKESTEDGSMYVRFGYSLNGVPLKIFEGYGAKFYVQNGEVRDFTIHMRRYTETEERLNVLPERQAVVATRAGSRPRLAYVDSGEDSRSIAIWIEG